MSFQIQLFTTKMKKSNYRSLEPIATVSRHGTPQDVLKHELQIFGAWLHGSSLQQLNVRM